MKKILLLYKTISKCRGKTNESKNAAVGDSAKLMKYTAMVFVAVALFFGGDYIQKHEAMIGGMESVFTLLFSASLLVSFFFSVPSIINQLYMSSDLDLLVTLPVRPMDIILCKLASCLSFPMLLSVGIVIPAGIGYGLAASATLGASYWIMLILSAVLLPAFTASCAAGLIILIMKLCHKFFSRNTLAVISALLAFALSVAFILLKKDTPINEDQTLTMVSTVANALGIFKAIPVISCSLAALQGDSLSILIVVAMTVGAVAAMLLLGRFFYFDSALGMADANGSSVKLTEEKLAKICKARSANSAMLRREIRTIFRTPSLITNGYLMSFAFPFLLFIPMILQMNVSSNDTQSFSATLAGFPILLWPVVLNAVAFLLSMFSVSLSCLPYGIISREGDNFQQMKTFPVSMVRQVLAKRNASLLILSIPGAIYLFIACIALAVMGFVPLWAPLYALAVGVLFTLFGVNLSCYYGVKKPKLGWENEADVNKNNTPGLIYLLVGFLLLVGCIVLAVKVIGAAPMNSLLWIGAAALPVVMILGTLIYEVKLRKAATQLPFNY